MLRALLSPWGHNNFIWVLAEQWIFLFLKALKSCSSSQPRRMQSPLVCIREKHSDSCTRSSRNGQGVETNSPTIRSFSPPTISPQRRNPQPPVRRTFLSPESPNRRFAAATPVHSYLPGGEFPLPDQSAGEHPIEQRENQLQQQMKPKTVRWMSQKGNF